MFTGQGVTDAVYYHLAETSSGVSFEDLYPKIKILIAALSTISFLWLFFALVKLKKIHPPQFRISLPAYVTLIVLITLSPFSKNVYFSFVNVFWDKGNPENVSPDYINIIKNNKKNDKLNYVFIYAESLERTFRQLNEKNYIPKLSSLADEYLEFTNIIQPNNSGFGWTMAGLVNTQCGIPLVIEQGNSGSNYSKFLANAGCVASWLNNNGYETKFIRGSQKEFAGGDKFLSQHGWKEQADLSYFQKTGVANDNNMSGWGLHDDVLLAYAWSEFQKMSSSGTPFLLSLLTVNTHSPDGMVLPVCNNSTDKSDSYSMLSAVRCSDFLLSQFISKIVNSQYFDNTIIVLTSDHLMMENDASTLLDKVRSLRRNNFIIIKKGLQHKKIDTQGTLLDVWPTILDISGNDKPLGFGRSLMRGKQSKFTSDNAIGNTLDYKAFSSNLWGVTSTSDSMSKSDDMIKIGNQKFKLPVYGALSNNIIDSTWFEGFAKNIINITHNGKSFFYANVCNDMGINDNSICAYIVTPKKITKMRITENGVISRKSFDTKPTFYKKNIIGISSAPYFMDNGLSGLPIENRLQSGINFINDKTGQLKVVNSYQTCAHEQVNYEKVNELMKDSSTIIYSSNDSMFCGEGQSYSGLAEILNSDAINTIKFRQQIIGFKSGSKHQAVVGQASKPLDVFIDTKELNITTLCAAFNDCM